MYQESVGCQPVSVERENFGWAVTSLDVNSGELRLIEVKGIGDATGTVLLTPNERRVAEDRRDCYWLYVVTNCNAEPKLTTVQDPARLDWQAVQKVQHYTINVSRLGDGVS